MSDFVVSAGRKYASIDKGHEMEVLFVHEASGTSMVQWMDNGLTATMYTRDIHAYYEPKVNRFVVGKRYINEDSGKVHEAVYVNEKYAVLVSDNHWPYSATHEYLKSNGGIFVVES